MVNILKGKNILFIRSNRPEENLAPGEVSGTRNTWSTLTALRRTFIIKILRDGS